jgi:hypothetical protein
LQTTTNLGPTAFWVPASASYSTNSGIISAVVPASNARSFFRLNLP